MSHWNLKRCLGDARDRRVGVFDLIACSESYPPHGEGTASLYMADGVVFCLQVFIAVDRRSHSVSDTLYGVFHLTR